MIFLQIIGMLIASAIISVILTPFLQYAFKLTEGQKILFGFDKNNLVLI